MITQHHHDVARRRRQERLHTIALILRHIQDEEKRTKLEAEALMLTSIK